MDEAAGTLCIISIAGIVFGDQPGRKAAAWMLIFSLGIAFILSPAFALALVLAPFAIVIMAVGGLVAVIKRLWQG